MSSTETPPSAPSFRYPPQALLLDANLIDTADRTRQDYGDLDSLAESIATNGLIHPPVVDANNRLIAGGRRLRALRDILKAPLIPVLVLETLDDAHLAILEAEENIRRKSVTWQERVLGVAKVHETSKRGAILNSRKWTIVETGEMLGVSFSNVNNALTLARLLRAGDNELAKCPSISDAIKLLISRKERELLKAQSALLLSKGVSITLPSSSDAKATLDDSDFFSPVTSQGVGVVAPTLDDNEVPGGGTAPSTLAQTAEVSAGPVATVPLSKLLHKGRMEDLCYSVLKAESVDHVICDWPYGINMKNLDTYDGIEDVKAEHDVSANVNDFETWLKAIYYVLKPNGFFITWYDLDHHEKLQDLATSVGFRTQRWPLIWSKTSACRNSAASKNFTKNYEVALLCRKGNATLLQPQSSSIWTGTADDLKVQLGHPFVKPIKLWHWLYAGTCMRGQTVLDPFAGVGSSTVAAVSFGLLPIAMECEAQHFDRLVINTANAFKALNPNTKFT